MAGRLRRALIALAFLTLGHAATAQTLGQAAEAARQGPPLDAAFRSDIERLMDMTGASQLAAQMATTMSDALLNGFQRSSGAIPPRLIEIVKDVLKTEFTKAFASSGIRDQQIALYAKYYTPTDVKGLIAFYESDLGKKAIANAPNLLREGAAIGEEWAKTAMPGVMEVLQARLKSEGLIP